MIVPENEDFFRFRSFDVFQKEAPFKVGLDAILLGAWTRIGQADLALDIGAGTGVLGLILASRSARMRVEAAEPNELSYRLCNRNFISGPWSERMRCLHTSIQQFARERHCEFDLIVSNPPYYGAGTKSRNQDRRLARHQDDLSYFQLLACVDRLLSKSGILSVVIPSQYESSFIQWARLFNFFPDRFCQIRTSESKKTERTLIELTRIKNPIHRNAITIRNVSGFTQAYWKLTGFLFPDMKKGKHNI